MDTTAAAQRLGTSTKTLRRFLRSTRSTFTGVGSGARYDFTEQEFTTLERRFQTWIARVGERTTPPKPRPAVLPSATPDDVRDATVWEEEGEIVLPDIRDPRIRNRVREIAREQEERLEERLMAAGLHVTQLMARRRTHA